MIPALVFIIASFLSLAAQTIKDIKTMKIDSRANFIMMGIVIGAYLFLGINFMAYLACTLLSIGFGHLTKNLFGEGDREMFMWILPGMYLLDYWYPLLFLFCLTLIAGLNFGLKHYKKILVKTPGMPVVMGAYLLSIIIYLGYLI